MNGQKNIADLHWVVWRNNNKTNRMDLFNNKTRFLSVTGN